MEGEVPGRAPVHLLQGEVRLLRADDQVFGLMLDGWRAHMLARALTVEVITNHAAVVQRFQLFTNDYPWAWRPVDVEEFLSTVRPRRGDGPASPRTLRAYASAIRYFCAYVAEPGYGWVQVCEDSFGDVPSQICFDWNTPRHTTDDDVPVTRRAFTKPELQALFDTVDDFVDAEHTTGSKRWLPALRDATAFKVAYAFGLRRRELAKLEVHDFGPNPHVPRWRGFGAVQVRWAKGTKGSGPRRRTVLTVPDFEWVVDLLAGWVTEHRPAMPTGVRSNALWPSERGDQISLGTLDRSFTRFRRMARLDENLTLHCLRHSYVTHLIEAGYDPLFVHQQVGHSYSSTTALYTSVSSDFKHRAVQAMIAQRLRVTPEEAHDD